MRLVNLMWQMKMTEDCQRAFDFYSKKRPRELKAVVDNLDTYYQALQGGIRPLEIKAVYLLRSLLALDQKGGGKGLAQTRLYFFPDAATETLFLITIADKNGPNHDLGETCQFLKTLGKAKATLPPDKEVPDSKEQSPRRTIREMKAYTSVTAMVCDVIGNSQFADELEEHIDQHQIGRQLFVIRNKQGLSERDLAARLKWTRGRVARLESTRDHALRIARLADYAAALGIDLTITLSRKAKTLLRKKQRPVRAPSRPKNSDTARTHSVASA